MYRYQRYFLLALPRSRWWFIGFSWFHIFFLLLFCSVLSSNNSKHVCRHRANTRYARFRSLSRAPALYFHHVKLFSSLFFAGGCMDWGFDFGFSFLFNFRKIHPWFCNVLRIGLVRFTSHLFLAIFCSLHTNEMNTSYVLVLNHRKGETSNHENERERANGQDECVSLCTRTRDEGTTKGHHRMDNKIKRNGEPTKGPCKI